MKKLQSAIYELFEDFNDDENTVNVFVIQISRSGKVDIQSCSKSEYQPLADRIIEKLRTVVFPKRELEKPANKLPI